MVPAIPRRILLVRLKPDSSEQNHDYLQFYIDSTLKDQISGEVDWQSLGDASRRTASIRPTPTGSPSLSGVEDGFDFIQ